MVVLVVDLISILAGESERHSPIAADPDRPGSLPHSLELVKDQPREAHVARRCRGVETAKDQTEALSMFGLDPALAPGGEELFETSVPKRLDRHQRECNL